MTVVRTARAVVVVSNEERPVQHVTIAKTEAPALTTLRPTCRSMGGIGGLSPQTYLASRGISEMPPRPPPTETAPPEAKPEPVALVTKEEIRAIMPHAREADIEKYLPALNRAMGEHEINTTQRKAAFLAQIAVESGELRYSEEIASGEAYEGRVGLGNTQPGDGKRFKGRGLIQLTGRANYRRIGKALGLDLENHPELAEQPENSARIAAHFFKARGLNEISDRGDIQLVSRRVNGGTNGMKERCEFYARACTILA